MSSLARFRVVVVFELTYRSVRIVAGDMVEGVVRMGTVLRPEHVAPGVEWSVAGIEFLDSHTSRESHVALELDAAPPLEELRRLLPPGSDLVSVD